MLFSNIFLFFPSKIIMQIPAKKGKKYSLSLEF